MKWLSHCRLCPASKVGRVLLEIGVLTSKDVFSYIRRFFPPHSQGYVTRSVLGGPLHWTFDPQRGLLRAWHFNMEKQKIFPWERVWRPANVNWDVVSRRNLGGSVVGPTVKLHTEKTDRREGGMWWGLERVAWQKKNDGRKKKGMRRWLKRS